MKHSYSTIFEVTVEDLHSVYACVCVCLCVSLTGILPVAVGTVTAVQFLWSGIAIFGRRK